MVAFNILLRVSDCVITEYLTMLVYNNIAGLVVSSYLHMLSSITTSVLTCMGHYRLWSSLATRYWPATFSSLCLALSLSSHPYVLYATSTVT